MHVGDEPVVAQIGRADWEHHAHRLRLAPAAVLKHVERIATATTPAAAPATSPSGSPRQPRSTSSAASTLSAPLPRRCRAAPPPASASPAWPDRRRHDRPVGRLRGLPRRLWPRPRDRRGALAMRRWRRAGPPAHQAAPQRPDRARRGGNRGRQPGRRSAPDAVGPADPHRPGPLLRAAAAAIRRVCPADSGFGPFRGRFGAASAVGGLVGSLYGSRGVQGRPVAPVEAAGRRILRWRPPGRSTGCERGSPAVPYRSGGGCWRRRWVSERRSPSTMVAVSAARSKTAAHPGQPSASRLITSAPAPRRCSRFA